jgi:hypothetical protein
MTQTKRLMLLALAVLAAGASPVAAQETCKREDFGTAVDSAGASLRKFNLEHQPKLNAKLEALRAKKGWKKTDSEDKAVEYLQDGRIGELDAQSNELLTKIDTLGRMEDGKAPDCAKLTELKAAGVELLAVMKAKSAYTLEKIDLELGRAGEAAKPAPVADGPAVVKSETPKGDGGTADVKIISKAEVNRDTPQRETAQREAAPKPEAKREEVRREPPRAADRTAAAPQAPAPEVGTRRGERLPDVPPPAVRPEPARPPEPSRGTQSDWQTSSDQAMLDQRDGGGRNDAYDPSAAGQPYSAPPENFAAGEEGYTIEEIRDATRGFFGTISTNLATVIEHAFSKSGRPTAYILGQEGGGAFLAGLRYGDGTLYMRSGGPHTQKIYWHGPSLGYDFGAEGSRTLFLIYKMHEPSEMFRTFTGIDGSAYVVGGVGVTFLKGGVVTMAPIRTGIGLRIGANLGYVRFTPQPTWNPF